MVHSDVLKDEGALNPSNYLFIPVDGEAKLYGYPKSPWSIHTVAPPKKKLSKLKLQKSVKFWPASITDQVILQIPTRILSVTS